jgi:hypothetical protein
MLQQPAPVSAAGLLEQLEAGAPVAPASTSDTAMRASLKRQNGNKMEELLHSLAHKKPKQKLSQRASAVLTHWWTQHFAWPYPEVGVN